MSPERLLLEALGPSRLDFAKQHRAERRESRRRIIEDGQDCLRLFGLEGERDDAPFVGVAQLCSELFVFQKVGELEEKRRREGDARQEHDPTWPTRTSPRSPATRTCTATYDRPEGKMTAAGGSCSTHVPPIVSVLHSGIGQAESIGPCRRVASLSTSSRKTTRRVRAPSAGVTALAALPARSGVNRKRRSSLRRATAASCACSRASCRAQKCVLRTIVEQPA
jgi:hypothetical protein